MSSVANGEIKQKIVLDGEKEYKSALKDAQRELRTLRSELKAETAELGKNATEQDKQAVKVKNLQKQIAEQEKIVRTYTKALEEVREKYGDNQDEIAKWEIKLNDARAALANMKSGLDDTSAGLKQVNTDAQMGVVAANSFAQAFEGLSSIGESISGAIEGVFSGVIDTVKAAIGELWDLITDTAARANNWTDLANYFGSTAEQVQLMDRAISASAGDFGKFTNLVTQLSFGGKNTKISEWFGVSDANYSNNVEYTMAVLEAMSNAYKEWGTGGKWDNAMADIFGAKRSADVSWFVTNYDTIIEKQKELQDNGFLMDSDTLSVLNEVHVELNSIEEKWDALKAKFGGGFGKITLDIATNVSGALDALGKYFEADTPEEREEALSELEENLTSAFKRLADAIRVGVQALDEVAGELKASEDPIVSTIGTILGGISEAVQWLTEDNAHNLVSALETIAGFWVAGKGLSMISKVGELAGHIMTIKNAGALGALTNALTGGGAEAAGAATTTAATTGAGGFLTGAAGIGGLALIAGGFGWAADRRLNHREEVLGTDENLNASAGGNDELMSTFAQWAGLQNQAENLDVMTATAEEVEEIYDRIGELWEKLEGMEGFDSLWDSYSAWRQENGMAGSDWSLPADWWKDGQSEDGVTSQDIQTLNRIPAETKAAVRELIGSIAINLDGERVADLLTSRVSRNIASEIYD